MASPQDKVKRIGPVTSSGNTWKISSGGDDRDEKAEPKVKRSLASAATIVPAAIGLGIAGKRIWANRSAFQDLLFAADPIAAHHERFLPGFLRGQTTPEATGIRKRLQQEILSDHLRAIATMQSTNLDKDVVQKLWAAAVQRADPRSSTRHLIVPGAENPLGTIAGLFTRYQGANASELPTGLSRTIEGFRRRLEAYAAQPISGLTGLRDLGELGYVPQPVLRAINISEVTNRGLRAAMEQIGGKLGAQLSAGEMVREGAIGGLYRFKFAGGTILGGRSLEFNIPRVLTAIEAAEIGLRPGLASGALFSGASQQTLRAAGEILQFIPGGAFTSGTFEDLAGHLALKRLQGDEGMNLLAGKMSQRQLSDLGKAFSDELMQYAETVNRTNPLALEVAASKVHAFTQGFRVATNPQIMDFMRSHPEFFAGPTPKRMYGETQWGRPHILSRLDPAKFSLFNFYYPAAKRPGQFIRDYRPSASAVAAMQANPYHAATAYEVAPELAARQGTDWGPRLRTTYVSDTVALAESEIALGAGEAAFTSRARAMMETVHERSIYLEQGTLGSLFGKDPSGARRFPVTPVDPAGTFHFTGGPLEVVKKVTGPGQVLAGEITGFEEGTNAPVVLQEGQRIKGYESFAARTGIGGEFTEDMATKVRLLTEDMATKVRLLVEETIDPGRTPKVFGTEKAILKFPTADAMRRVHKQLGIDDLADGIASADRIIKNRSLHNQQMFGEMVYIAKQVMDKGKVKRRWGGGMLARWTRMATEDPGALATRIERLGRRRGPQASGKVMHAIASNYRFTSEQMGSVFGLLPSVEAPGLQRALEAMSADPGWRPHLIATHTIDYLKQPQVLQEAMKRIGYNFSFEEIEQIQKGVVHGPTALWFGGPASLTGAGNIGRLEPRMFELLSGPQWGALGQQMREELIERGALANPMAVEGQRMFGAALAELHKHPHSVSLGLPSMKISDLNIKDILDPESPRYIGTKGGVIDLEGTGGLGRLVVPSESAVTAMAPYGTEGAVMQSEMSKAYRGFLGSIGEYRAGKISPETLATDAGAMREALLKGYSQSVVGRTGIASTEMPGSRFLRVVSPSEVSGAGAFADEFLTAGISKRTGGEMYEEMRRLYAHEPATVAALATQEKQFLAGEAVPGFLARHPIFNPFSGAPMQIKMRQGHQDDIVTIKEAHKKILMEGDFKLPAGVVPVGKKPWISAGTVDIGILPAFLADKDADTMFTTLLSPKMSKNLEGHFGNASEWLQNFREYSFRAQLIREAGRGKGLMTPELLERVGSMGSAEAAKELAKTQRLEHIADMLKLGGAQEYVPTLSTAMSEARRGLLSNVGLSAERRFKGLSLIDLLEQMPIASKHLGAADIINRPGAFGASIQALSSSIKNLSTEGLEIGTRSLLALREGGDDVIEALVGQGGKFAVEGLPGMFNIQGLDLHATSQDLIESLRAYRDTSQGMSRAAKDNLLLRGAKGTSRGISAGAIPELLKSAGGHFYGDMAVPIMETTAGTGATISRAATTVWNKVAALGGQAMKIGSKPLAWGFGTSIALATILSRPKGTLEPDASRPPPSGMLRAREASHGPENVHPEDASGGSPSTPNYPGPGKAYIEPRTNPYNRIQVRAQSGRANNYEGLSAQMKARLGRNNRVNVTVNDRRSSLTPQRVDDIISRG